MAKTVTSESGASLVEISITLIIITMTTLIILSFSRNSSNMNKDAKANDTAVLIAEQKITDLATITYNTLPQSGNDAVTRENIVFARSWTVTQSGFITVAKVTVSWNAGSRSITLAGAVN